MLWCVDLRRCKANRGCGGLGYRMSAFDAEFGIDREYRAAIRASSRQRACAFLAELRLDTVIVLAGCALHRSLPKAAAKLMNMQPLREPPIFNVEAKRRIK